jgi:ketosteroid isomerase-like protein
VSRENVELIRRLYDAVAARDSETVLAIYHPEVVWDHSNNSELAHLTGSTVYHGHDGLREWSRQYYEAWDDVTAELEDVIDVGDDRVVAVLNYQGRGRVSGAEVQITRMAGIFTIRDGQVTRAEWYRNEPDALRASGIERQSAPADE